MSREEKARSAVQTLIPDDTIVDVAITYPRGFTRAQGAGMVVGGLAGGNDFASVGLALGSVAGGKLFADAKDMPSSIVLAVSPTAVYALGRNKTGPFGGWDHLTPMVKFDRDHLDVAVHQRAVTLEITLTDTEHDVTLDLEAKRAGTLDVRALLELLRLSPAHLDNQDPDEDSDTED